MLALEGARDTLDLALARRAVMLGAVRAAERAVLVRHDLELFGMVDGRYRLLVMSEVVVEHHTVELADLVVRRLDRW